MPLTLARHPDGATARLAILLLDAGVLTEPRWRRDRRHLERSCRAALADWLNQQCGTLRIIRPMFQFDVGRERDRPASPDHDDAFWLRIEWYAREPSAHAIGPRIEWLESRHKGLGKAAIRELTHVGWQSFPLFTCDDQLHFAEWVMWGGCSDEKECAEMNGMDDEEAEAYFARTVPKADILAAAPEWLFRYGKQWNVSDRRLHSIAKQTNDPLCREVAEIVLAARTLPSRNEFFEEAHAQGGEFVGFSAVAQWSADDPTLAIVERFYEYAYEGGEGFGCCGAHVQRLDDMDAFHGWMDEMQRLFACTRLLDRLLTLLSGAN